MAKVPAYILKIAARQREADAARGFDKVKVRRAQPEGDLSETVAPFMDLNFPEGGEVFWSATANGMKTSAIIGGQMVRRGLRKGVLDILVIPLSGPKVGITHWIELKAKGGKPTKEQARVLRVLVPLEYAAVCRSIDEVAERLTSWGFTLRARP